MSKRIKIHIRTLADLQNLCKRDSAAYREEFLQQLRHYESSLEVLKISPKQQSTKDFGDLVAFLCAVAPCYPAHLVSLPQQIIDLLQQHSHLLEAELRRTLCQALILLRNRNMLTSTILLELFFKLFRCPDRPLREMLYKHIVSDIRKINEGHKNNAVNKVLQNFLYQMLTDDNKIAAKMSLDAMIELYHRKVWNDAKTVNVISTACFSPITKIMVAAVKFFLGTDEGSQGQFDDENNDTEGAMDEYQRTLKTAEFRKATKKQKANLTKAAQNLHRKQRKQSKSEVFNFSALHLVHDPQGMAERLFVKLKNSNDAFEVKLMIMNLISRLIGIHKLILLNFYPFLQRYLQPFQRDVTQVLTYTAQSSHEMIPSDVIEAIIMTIANSFISERATPEAIAVGMNTIREICSRCPHGMTEDLLSDLVQYKTHRDKSVIMATRSLIQVFREVNPDLLHKKERGKPNEIDSNVKSLAFGEHRVEKFVPGTELLAENDDEDDNEDDNEDHNEDNDNDSEADGNMVIDDDDNNDDDDDDDNNDDDDDDDDDEEEDGEWVDVASDDEDVNADEEDDQEEEEDEDEDEDEDEEEESAAASSKSSATTTTVKAKKKSVKKAEKDLIKKTIAVKVEQKAKLLSSTKILTDEDFAKIRAIKLNKVVNPNEKSRKRLAHVSEAQDEEEEEDEGPSDILDPSSILPMAKRKRQDKEERLASIHEGREGRKKFGQHKGKLNEHASTTNKEKARHKLPAMIRHRPDVIAKKFMSMRDKQMTQHKSHMKDKRGR